jgi:hypothetical protein
MPEAGRRKATSRDLALAQIDLFVKPSDYFKRLALE